MVFFMTVRGKFHHNRTFCRSELVERCFFTAFQGNGKESFKNTNNVCFNLSARFYLLTLFLSKSKRAVCAGPTYYVKKVIGDVYQVIITLAFSARSTKVANLKLFLHIACCSQVTAHHSKSCNRGDIGSTFNNTM